MLLAIIMIVYFLVLHLLWYGKVTWKQVKANQQWVWEFLHTLSLMMKLFPHRVMLTSSLEVWPGKTRMYTQSQDKIKCKKSLADLTELTVSITLIFVQPAAPQEAFSPGLIKNEWGPIDMSSLTHCDDWHQQSWQCYILVLRRTPQESPSWTGRYVIFKKANLQARIR